MGIGRVGRADDLDLGGPGQVTGHVTKDDDPVHLGHVEVAIAKGDPARHGQPLGQDVNGVGPVVAVRVHHRVHLALGARADEHDSARTGGQLPRVRHVGRVDAMLKPGGKVMSLASAARLGRTPVRAPRYQQPTAMSAMSATSRRLRGANARRISHCASRTEGES